MSKVPKGYKQTEVGLIPEDWEVKELGELFCFLNNATYSRSELSQHGNVGYIHYGDIHTRWEHHLNLNTNTLPKITDEKSIKYSLIEEGDLVMADASEDIDGVGKAIEVIETQDKKVIAGLHTILLRDRDFNFAKKFKGYIHANPLVRRQFQTKANGLKVYGLSKSNLARILIPLPPTLAEQEAIAKVLSDMDAQLQAQDELIAKKRQVKQATMEALLTGRQRLSGFGKGKGMQNTELGEIPEDWEVKALGELGAFKKGQGIFREDSQSGEIPAIRYGELYTRHHEIIRSYYSSISKAIADSSTKLTYGDILFAASGETKAEIGKCAAYISQGDTYAGSDIIIITQPKANSIYLGYLLNLPLIAKQKAAFGQGDAVVHITANNLAKVQIPLPPTLEEQTAIAEVLQAQDAELEALAALQAKYAEIKTALLEDLLTGKRRVHDLQE